jgi:hypothetical protein
MKIELRRAVEKYRTLNTAFKQVRSLLLSYPKVLIKVIGGLKNPGI